MKVFFDYFFVGFSGIILFCSIVRFWHKKLVSEEPEVTSKRADAIIKNTHRTLMTRGQKGCYIFSTDNETKE